MNTSKPIQIFKPGNHTAMSGAALSFSETDLAATAQAYDPAKHEAPLVCGHPAHDDPAYGWVGSLSFADGALEADTTQVDAAFAEMVSKGSFKKISASFYAPDSPSNPVPGVYYLRHVGFLGAMPPAVKGLRNPSFADAEQGVVEFAEWDDVDNANLWRSMREWILGKFGLEEADKAVPGYTVKNLETSAQKELDESLKEDQAAAPAAAFAEPQPVPSPQSSPAESPSPQSSPACGRGGERERQSSLLGRGGKREQHSLTLGDEMSAEEKAQLAALQAENATLKSNQAAFAEADKKRKTDARHTEHVSFAEGLVKEGKLLPTNKDVTVATLDFMAAQEQVIEFGEGDAKKPLLDAYKAALLAGPKLVAFGEVAGAARAATAAAFKSPDGLAVDADRLALHNKAIEFAEANSVTYEVALLKVSA